MVVSCVLWLSQQSTTLGKLETRIDHFSCRTLANTTFHFYAIASVDFCMSSSDEFYFQPTHFTGTFRVVLYNPCMAEWKVGYTTLGSVMGFGSGLIIHFKNAVISWWVESEVYSHCMNSFLEMSFISLVTRLPQNNKKFVLCMQLAFLRTTSSCSSTQSRSSPWYRFHT